MTIMMTNQSIANPNEWDIDGMHYTEVISQNYSNCKFSAGFVENCNVPGHENDTMYLRFERTDDVRFILLTPDEAACISWLMSGLLWTHTLNERPPTPSAVDPSGADDHA